MMMTIMAVLAVPVVKAVPVAALLILWIQAV
jgi:hypothetical protein